MFDTTEQRLCDQARAIRKNGWLSEDDIIKESLIGIKRAGATAIFTYFAPSFATVY